MLSHALPFGAFYDFGDKVGSLLATLFFLLMVVAFAFVMAKYVFGKGGLDKKNAA